MDRLLTVGEVAALLGVPRSWVYDRTGRKGPEGIPHFKLGKYVRFRQSEVAMFMEARRCGGRRERQSY